VYIPAYFPVLKTLQELGGFGRQPWFSKNATKSKNRCWVFLYQAFREKPLVLGGGLKADRFSGSGMLKELEPMVL
jgi:hypothetical protein